MKKSFERKEIKKTCSKNKTNELNSNKRNENKI